MCFRFSVLLLLSKRLLRWMPALIFYPQNMFSQASGGRKAEPCSAFSALNSIALYGQQHLAQDPQCGSLPAFVGLSLHRRFPQPHKRRRRAADGAGGGRAVPGPRRCRARSDLIEDCEEPTFPHPHPPPLRLPPWAGPAASRTSRHGADWWRSRLSARARLSTGTRSPPGTRRFRRAGAAAGKARLGQGSRPLPAPSAFLPRP